MKLFRIALLCVAAAMAGIVAARMLFGPFHLGPLPVTIPLNPEGFFRLAVTALLSIRVTRAGTNQSETTGSWRTSVLLSLGVVALGAIALRRGLGIYFLSDDFILVRIGHEWTAAAFRYSITHGGGDGFFRPFGFVSLALDARLGGIDPVFWHASSVAIHSANAVLVLFLARRLGASTVAAGFAGALFAIHGIDPEAVVWIAGRFDLLATFFLLAGLLVFTMADANFTLHSAALGCFAVAALCKESAFIFPLLVAGYALWNRQPLRRAAPYFALAAMLFAYRWSLFGGIGGYIDRASGRPAAFSLGLGSTLKAAVVRLWTSLYFPLNWTTDPSLPLALLATAYMAAMIWLGLRQKPARTLWPVAAAILICTIPVLSLLAGSPTLAGSRVLYLPAVWFAILLALAVDGVPGRVRYAIAAIMLVFHFAALQHNLGFWEAASARVRAACETGTTSLPDAMNGVPMLANGREECIEIAHNKFGPP